MTYIKMDEPEYWEVPKRLQSMQDLRRDRGRSKQFVLGDPDDDSAAAGLISELPALAPVPRHGHDCHSLTLVIKGSLFVPGKVLYPGDGMTANPHEIYGPWFTGPEGCTVVEFFGALTGLIRGLFEKKNGEIFEVDALTTLPSVDTMPEFSPEAMAGMEILDELRAAAHAAAAQR